MDYSPYYIIKTKEGEYVKVYAINDIFQGPNGLVEPKEFSEYGLGDCRRWKSSEVDIVEYPIWECGMLMRRRTYKYIYEKIDL